MPSRADVRNRLAHLMNEIGKIPMDRITDTATVEDDLQIGSLAFLELQVAIEDEYQVQIDPIKVVELNEFSAIVDYVYNCAVSGQQ